MMRPTKETERPDVEKPWLIMPMDVPPPLEAGVRLYWVDHLSLQAGDATVSVTIDPQVGWSAGTLTSRFIRSTTVGDTGPNGAKFVEMVAPVPPGYTVHGVRLGYKLLNRRTHVSQVRIAQVQSPPATALVLLDDPTNHLAVGPRWVDSAPCWVDPEAGPLLLSLFVNFGDTADAIAIRGIGLHLRAKP